MRLYRVLDYAEVDRWFGTKAAAFNHYDGVLEDRAQEKSEFLEVRVYRTPITPEKLVFMLLNVQEQWMGNSEVVRKAKP